VKLDPAQRTTKAKLDALLIGLQKTPISFVSRLFGSKPISLRGLYIWGSVGRGKTMLMDQFFAQAPNLPKRRVHFNGFMQEVHAARSNHKSNDVISEIADGLAAKAKLLCLDEMQVTDIADAMILGRLFEALLARKVTIVTTSNQPPDGLYRDGLNRQLFLPFIAKIKSALDVIELGQGQDYRLGRIASDQVYLTPLGAKADQAMDKIWHDLADGEPGIPTELAVLGRKLIIPRAAHSCARFNFAELCENPLAAPDYLVLAKTYKTILIDHVPIIKPSDHNAAKRFILLIDTLYDAKTKLVLSAAAIPEQLCPSGQHKAEFLRTTSRLREMQSASWWNTTI
jgi:cell division protein ZapE